MDNRPLPSSYYVFLNSPSICNELFSHLQIGIGAVGGWATGFVFGKVGRAAATTLGTSLVLFQLANHYG